MTRRQKQTVSCTPTKTENCRPRFRRRTTRVRNRRLNLQLQGWLLLLPAVVLLATFTHVPAVSTVINSLFSTPQGRRPAAFIGLDQYGTMLADPIFWRARPLASLTTMQSLSSSTVHGDGKPRPDIQAMIALPRR